jgi:cytochrome c553
MLSQTPLLILTVILLMSANALQADEEATAARDTIREEFLTTAQPFLGEFCVACHGPDVTKPRSLW